MSTETERLRMHKLPVFFTLENLADLIGIDCDRLETLTNYANRFYKKYEIPKKNHQVRIINQPALELKNIQRWILRHILYRLYPSEHATAYIKGKNLLCNVEPHCENNYFLSLDITNFFPSITKYRVRKIFSFCGYSYEIAEMLTLLCTFLGRLPQGGATSPALSNLVCNKLDFRLAGLSKKHGLIYTRYADDLTFSSQNRKALHIAFPTIKTIIQSEKFCLNETKTRFQNPANQCRINGLVKDSSKPVFSIGRKKKIKMRAIMHHFCSGHALNGPYNNAESINGWLNYVKGVDEKSYYQMLVYWKRLKEKYHSVP